MDKKQVIKMLTGTVARGVMWILAFVSATIGADAPSEEVGTQIAGWVIAVGLAVGSLLWSKYKDKKNVLAEPPKPLPY